LLGLEVVVVENARFCLMFDQLRPFRAAVGQVLSNSGLSGQPVDKAFLSCPETDNDRVSRAADGAIPHLC